MSLRKDVTKLVRKLELLGVRVDRDRRHYVVYPPDVRQSIVVIAKTPSSQRAIRNKLAELRRSGIDV